MKHSNQLDYLATIKKNHKIHTHIEPEKNDHIEDKIFRHLRALKNANRLSGIKLLQSYSVAEHCYYTGLLFETIAEYERIRITRDETYFVYRHDIIETITGDILLPVKIHSEIVKNKWESIERTIIRDKYTYLIPFLDSHLSDHFSKLTWNLFKACDLFELYLFCQEEIELGNMTKGVWTVLKNCQNLLPEFNIHFINERIDQYIKFNANED